ncbi:MAG: hypothetical protein GOU97_04085 [Nanoarchaeota archaeon]|nr:hypothetical protein [Nanoarchaeota archaeon]
MEFGKVVHNGDYTNIHIHTRQDLSCLDSLFETFPFEEMLVTPFDSLMTEYEINKIKKEREKLLEDLIEVQCDFMQDFLKKLMQARAIPNIDTENLDSVVCYDKRNCCVQYNLLSLEPQLDMDFQIHKKEGSYEIRIKGLPESFPKLEQISSPEQDCTDKREYD